MDFMKWLDSFDELLYEVMSWLIFYPATLWRTVMRPLAMMRYSQAELGDVPDRQYEDVLRPPLFLVLSILLAHGFELASGHGDNPIVASRKGLDALVSDDTSLLVLRVLLFALLPLAMAAWLVRRRGLPLTRSGLRAPFYAQCYPAGSLALFLGIATLVATTARSPASIIGGFAVPVLVIVYVGVAARWFARELSEHWLRGVIDALIGFTLAALLFFAAARAFVRVS